MRRPPAKVTRVSEFCLLTFAARDAVASNPSVVGRIWMTVGNKVRIYDLAKELKLETKRLIEEVRREGFDVSVPSNTVPKELADKIRNRYFPKQETKRAPQIRVVKKQRTAEEGGEEIHVSVAPEATDDGAATVVAEASSEDA